MGLQLYQQLKIGQHLDHSGVLPELAQALGRGVLHLNWVPEVNGCRLLLIK